MIEPEYKYIDKEDRLYPERLRQIADPPKRLYYRGDISLLDSKCMAVVGSRKPTEYGAWAAKRIGKRLGESGITVVSGLAAGIDGLAHEGCLDAKGRTIAVLGCGIDICYPASNRKLFAKIEETGLIISEYEPGVQATRYTFPRRNRIISGISEGVVVVEAGLQSGSLITAELAAEQGRHVYALPGNINNVMSIGTNMLIRDGATAIAVIDDILRDSGISPAPDQAVNARLSDDEKRILEVVKNSGECTSDYICDRLGMPAGKVNGIVTVLEMKGLVCFSLGKIFIADC